MLFNHDSGLIQSILTIDTTVAPVLGGSNTLQIIGTGGLILPVGTTAERPATPVAGLQRFNSTTAQLEYFNGTVWVAGVDGTVTSITVTADGAALQVNGGASAVITDAGTFALTLDQTLVNLAASSPTASGGPVVRLSDDTFISRDFIGTAPVIVTNGDGVAGNPTISVNAELTGLSAPTDMGFEARIAAGTYAQRTIVGTGSIVVTNGDGIAGNPTISYTAGANLGGLEALNGVGYVVQTGPATFANRTISGTANAATGTIVVTDGGAATGTSISFTPGVELGGVAALATSGMVARTAAGAYTGRTLTGSTSSAGVLSFTNGDGVAGNPTVEFAPAANLATLATTTVTGLLSRAADGAITGKTVTGGGSINVNYVGDNIVISYTAGANLGALDAMTGTGIMVRTGVSTYTNVAVAGTAGNVVVTNGDGIAGAPTIDLAAVTQAFSGTFSKVTLDGFGRVTGNTPVTTADITALVDATYVNVTGDTMSGVLDMGANRIANVGAPVQGTDATNKNYVDAMATGLSWKQSVRAATTGNITLSGAQAIDGVAVVAGDRVLVRAQTDATQNGIYVASATAWARSEDLDAPQESRAATMFVEEGTAFADTAWTQTTEVVTIGTTPMSFTQFAGAGSYTAGTGLTLTGNAFSITAPISTALGGTGLTTTGSSGQLLAVGAAGLEYKTATAGAGVSITDAAGSVTIANTGVLSNVAGAGISVSGATGNVTIANTGVLSVATAGTGVSAATVAGVVTLTGNAVTSVVTSGVGITASAPVAGVVTIANTGITSAVAAGTGVSVATVDGVLTITGSATAVQPGLGIAVDQVGGTATVKNTGVVSITGVNSLSTSFDSVTGVATITNDGITSAVAGTGITVSSATGAVTFTNNGVVSLQGTTNQTTVSGTAGGTFTVGLPASVTVDTALTVTGLGADKALRTGAAGLVEGITLGNGQFLIGATGAAPAAGTITAGTGVTVTNSPNGITIALSGGAAAVTSVTGAVAVGSATALTVTNTGTAQAPIITYGVDAGLESLAALSTTGIVVQSATDTFVTRSLVAGLGVSITGDVTLGDLTIANTGVTSVGLALPSIFSVTGSPVTTTGTLTATLASQTAGTVFAAPADTNGAPAFRALAYSDLPIKLYAENRSSEVAPVATGANAVALGSAASAVLAGQVAHASGQFAAAGDAQSIEMVLRGSTTDATAGELFLDGAALRAALPNNSAWNFTVQVVGRRTDGTAGAAAYRFDGIIVKDATAASTAFIGVPSKNILGETQAAWDAAVVADATNGALALSVTGQAAAAIKWVATIRATQVIG